MKQKKPSGRALVIQLGRDELRIALTVLGAAAPKLQQCVAVPVPEGTVEDGMLRDPETLREILRSALKRPEFKRTRRVVFSICSAQIISETAAVPAVSPKKMAKLLESNMDLYFPVDAKEYHLVWKIIGPAGSGESGQEVSVQLWAVPNTLLAGYYALANSCGLSVAAIDYCGASLAAAVGASFSAAPKAAKARGRRREGARSSGGGRRGRPDGTEPFTATAVMDPPETEEGHNIPNTQLFLLAEREYLMMTFVQAGQVKLQRLLLCGSDPEGTLSEAMMVLEYYGSMDAGRYSEVSGILCGALADDAAYEQAVRDMLNLPVCVLQCEQGPAWCVCLGMARMTLDFGVPTMNQRGDAGRQLAQAWQYGLVLVGGALLAASLLLAFGSRVNWRITLDGLDATAKSLELQAAQNSGNAQRYHAYEAVYDSYSADWDTLLGTDTQPGALRTYNDNLVLALEELEGMLPKTARVVTIGIAGQGLALQLACESKEDVAYTIIKLRDLEYAALNSISNMSYGSGINAQQVLSALAGKDAAEAAAALAESAGTAAQQPAEAAPTEGSQLDINSLLDQVQLVTGNQATLELIVSGGGIDRDDLEDALDDLDEDQLEIIAELYGKRSTDYDLEEILDEARLSDRKKALRNMLTDDPIAAARFGMLLKEDAGRETKDQKLFKVILPHLIDDLGLGTLSAIAGGDMEELQRVMPELLDILTKNEETVSATENLIKTDNFLSQRLAYYLAVEIGWEDRDWDVDDIDIDELLKDITNGSLPNTEAGNDAADILAEMLPDLLPDIEGTGSPEMQSWFKNYLTGQDPTATWDVVWTLLGGDEAGPGAEIDPSENAEYTLDDKYYITVTLKYKEELIQAELKRKGLSYGDKLAKLEVG